ncbi:glycosyltransferase [Confluentibacter lentus]|uniref:glycosyltransferase n=1 Tax=Confluentibacter lentus TaxID=1699412 RepID=UPI000C28E96E|nr:glycosyltransferase [Confluentibacter lentus]
MKVLQLIDSLDAGGAERVAVNYANSLANLIEASYLCSTRKEGLLKESLSNHVAYLFLNRKSTFDFKAIKKLHVFVKINKINIVHAHSSSFFIASIIKILNPKIALIWHDHYGKSEFLNDRPKFVLTWCSKLFDHIVTVNTLLQNWSEEILGVKSVSYLPNFATISTIQPITQLQGKEGRRIVCLANLRAQKDHITLLEAFKTIKDKYPEWTMHLIGQDFNDAYSLSVKTFIKKNNLESYVFIYGSCSDVFNILSQCTIGVLASKSEGLPLALLEYGLAKLPVVATNVGDCSKVISNDEEGFLISSENHKVLAEALLIYINDLDLRVQVGHNLHLKVLSTFSQAKAIETLIEIYKTHQK